MGWDGKLDATDKRASKALGAMEKAGLYDSNDPKDVAKRNAGIKKLEADKKSGMDYAMKLLKERSKMSKSTDPIPVRKSGSGPATPGVKTVHTVPKSANPSKPSVPNKMKVTDKRAELAANLASRKQISKPIPKSTPKPKPNDMPVPQKQPGKDPYRQYKSPGYNGFHMNLPKG